MNNEDWAKRWIDGKTGWHKNAPNERLLKYFPKITKRVFVPLCGKTVDLMWQVLTFIKHDENSVRIRP